MKTLHLESLFLQLSRTSLVVFRWSLGIVLLLDLILRYGDLQAHYSDNGLMPRGLLFDSWSFDSVISIHTYFDSPFALTTIFLIHAITIALTTIGYRPRLFAAISWVLLISLQNRNPIVLYGGDIALRMILLLTLFLPLPSNKFFNKRPLRDSPTWSLASGLPLATLLVCIYFFSSMEKLLGDGWLSGTAMFDALGIQHLVTPFGTILRNWKSLTIVLSYAALAFELLAPFLLLFSQKMPKVRTILVLSFVGFHGMTALCFQVGLFPMIMATIWLVFLPEVFWQWVGLTQHESNQKQLTVKKRDQLEPHSTPTCLLPYGTPLLWALIIIAINIVEPFTKYEAVAKFYWNPVTRFLRLDQRWNMFQDTFHQLDGKFQVNIVHRSNPKPVLFDLYKNHRWVKASIIAARGNREVANGILRWVCFTQPLPSGKKVALNFFEAQRNPFPNPNLHQLPLRQLAAIECP